MSYLIGIDLGGSSIKALVATSQGERLDVKNRSFDQEESQDWAREIRSLVEDIESEQGTPAAGLGLSAPGLVDSKGRSIRNMPGRLEGLVGLDWTTYLQRDHVVPVSNDAQSALAGEAWVGAVKDIDNVVFLTLGTGVGGAAKVDGNILRGAIGRAGHLGHICLDPSGAPDICRTPGSLELAIGNCTIRERTGNRFGTTHELVDSVRAGDSEACRLWAETIRNLACGLVSLINVLDPEVIVIGGGIARADELLFNPLRDRLDELEWIVPGSPRVSVRAAQLGEWAGAYGAAYSALAS